MVVSPQRGVPNMDAKVLQSLRGDTQKGIP